MSNLTPTKIVDKNGFVTTRNKKTETSAQPKRTLVAPTLTVSESSSVTVPPIGTTFELPRYNFETSDIYEDTLINEDTGEVLVVYNDEFDKEEKRVPYLAGEDGITASAVVVDAQPNHLDENGFAAPRNQYLVELSIFDGNKGIYRTVETSYQDQSESIPSVGSVMHAIALSATGAEDDAQKLRTLVGDVRYGDYVYGRSKAEHGYDSGITYA